jgi:hypothetical protein
LYRAVLYWAKMIVLFSFSNVYFIIVTFCSQWIEMGIPHMYCLLFYMFVHSFYPIAFFWPNTRLLCTKEIL